MDLLQSWAVHMNPKPRGLLIFGSLASLSWASANGRQTLVLLLSIRRLRPS